MNEIASQTLQAKHLTVIIEHKMTGKRLKVTAKPSKMPSYLFLNYFRVGWRQVEEAF